MGLRAVKLLDESLLPGYIELIGSDRQARPTGCRDLRQPDTVVIDIRTGWDAHGHRGSAIGICRGSGMGFNQLTVELM